MRMKKCFVLVLTALMLMSLVFSAGAQDTKSLSLAFVQEIDSLNYGLYSSQFFSSILTSIWNSPPWVFDDNLNPVPRLATEIPSADNGGVSADGKTITIRLRDDIVWSDGTPITSADFVFTYEMFMADGNAVDSRSPYDKMDSVTAPDAQTVVVQFTDVYAPWLTSIFTQVHPQHILAPIFEADGTLDNADYNRTPTVSSGPFVVSEWQTGNYILFSRNEAYFDEPAKLDQIYVRFVPDDAAQVAALINGDVDMGIFISPDDARTLQQNGVSVVTVNSGYNEGLYFNFKADTAPTIKDLAVRQAIAYGLNRQGIVEDLLRYGDGEADHNVVATSFWYNTPWANDSLELEAYDPEIARQLLEDAGWVDSDGDGIRERDGERLSLTWATNQRTLRTQVQAVGQQQLAEIGIEVELVNLPSDIFFGSYGDANPVALGEYDFWEFSTTPGSFPDPNHVYWTCAEIPSDENPSGVNDMYLCDQELDALFAAQASNADPEARREIFQQIQQLMYDQVYWLPMWHDPDLYALSAQFSDARIAPTTQFWNSANWDAVS
ncbi:MAG: peptide ABC transporter substrate-binding protein [Chloroflexota bacterium]|nr:peptide ABC transporter substrate-binding protein [Chloroflexota bacterium]